MDRWQYLIVMAICLLLTAPLEIVLGARVYRRPVLLTRTVLPVVAIFLVWDGLAIAADVWSYNPRYLTGVRLPFAIPLEELVFFLVIPLCALLTYEAVTTLLARLSSPACRCVRKGVQR